MLIAMIVMCERSQGRGTIWMLACSGCVAPNIWQASYQLHYHSPIPHLLRVHITLRGVLEVHLG